MAHSREREATAALLAGFGRAFAGALLFALPMLMTMEMWRLGHVMEPTRLALLCVVTLPLLVRLSQLGGMRRTKRLTDDLADALVAVGIAAVAASAILWLFGALHGATSAREAIGMIALQTLPASIGAMLARNQLGGVKPEEEEAEEDEDRTTYGGELFLMVAGALFLSLNVAPTDEVVLIAYQMDPWRELGLLIVSVALMHGFVFSLGFRGAEGGRPHEGFWSLLGRYTIVGYALVLLVCLYVLWSFGRWEGHAVEDVLSAAIVLGLPGSIGAAAARLIL